MVERAASQVYRPSPPLSPASFDFAIAEIAARQNELDAPAARPMPPRGAPPRTPATAAAMAPAMPTAPPIQPAAPAGPDFSSLERHLFKITSQIEALQRPDRDRAIDYRVPHRACRKSVTPSPRRCRAGRSNRSRTKSARCPAASTIPARTAATARRWPASNARSREIREVAALADPGRTARRLRRRDPQSRRQARPDPARQRRPLHGPAARRRHRGTSRHRLQCGFQRRAGAACRRRAYAVVQGRPACPQRGQQRFLCHSRTAHRGADLDAGKPRAAVGRRKHRTSRGRAARIVGPHRPHAGRQRQRIGFRPSRTARVVSAGADRNVRPIRAPAISAGSRTGCRTSCAISKASMRAWPRSPRTAATAVAPQPVDSGIVDIVKREMSDIRFSQSETDRRTQDSLETVHNTLGHVVDRLAMIEGDLRTARALPVAPQLRNAAGAATRCRRKPPRTPRGDAAAAEARTAESRRGRACSISPPRRANSRPRSRRTPAVAAVAPRAISEILEPYTARAARRDRAGSAAGSSARTGNATDRAGRRRRRSASPLPKARSAKLPPAADEPVSTSSFIAAARRAAQAAAAAPPPEKAALAARSRPAPATRPEVRRQGTVDDHLQDPLAAGRRERGRDRARHLQDGDDAARQRQPRRRCRRSRIRATGRLRPSRPRRTAPGRPRPRRAAPSMTSPTPIDRQSFNNLRTRHAHRDGRDPASGSGAARRAGDRQATSPAPFRPGRPPRRAQADPCAGAADRKAARWRSAGRCCAPRR